MEKELISSNMIEDVSMSEILGLASWDRRRSDEEISDFLNRHSERLTDFED